MTSAGHGERARAFAPSNPTVFRALGPTYPSLAGLSLRPAGGEAFGALHVVSLSVTDVPDGDEALLCVWKAATCFAEDWLYEAWDTAAVDAVIKHFYTDDHAHWSSMVNESPSEFVAGILDAARRVQRGQRDLGPRALSPRYFPDEAAVQGVELDQLAFLNERSLRAVLVDAWNELEGFFCYDQRWYLASWSTNA